jgi:2-keto-3-deoxy-L-rhamnonate aldolase RhmA
VKNLKQALSNGEILWGTIIMSSSPVNVEISAYLGYDFAFIDSEHASASPYGIEMENLIRAADAGNIAAVIRVIENNLSQIRKPLDFGAKGIIAPLINTKKEARRLVDACLYPPDGNRGAGPGARATKYGTMEWFEYMEKANRELFIGAIIERLEGIKNLEEILSVKGISAIFLGPFDLAIELGIKPKNGEERRGVLSVLRDPMMDKHMDYIISTCGKYRVPVGTVAWDVDSAMEMVERGCQIVCISTDTNMFAETAKKYIESVREGLKKINKR